MSEILAFLSDPDVISSILIALFIVNGVLTITLAFRCLDPIRAEGVAVAVLSVVSFLVCANLLEGREALVMTVQAVQFLLLVGLNIAYRRRPVPRRRPVQD